MASRQLGLVAAAAAAAVVGGGGNGGIATEDVPAIATKESPAEGVPAVEVGGDEAVPGDLVPVITVEEEKEVDLEGHEEGAEEEEEAAVAEGDADWDGEEEGVKGWLKPYSSTQSILVVGDGDFSFSWALAVAFCSAGNLVATSIDSYGLFT
jgi:25S rRNA (uracil2634-N3)-methyltransferase